MNKFKKNDPDIKKVRASVDSDGYYLIDVKNKYGDLADPSNPYFTFFLLINSLPFISGGVTKKIVEGDLDIDYVAFWITKVLKLQADEDSLETYFNLLLENGQDDYEKAKKMDEIDYVFMSVKLMSKKVFKYRHK